MNIIQKTKKFPIDINSNTSKSPQSQSSFTNHS